MSGRKVTWVWLPKGLILSIHDEQLAEHGGGAGVRDEGLLESALARAENLAHYAAPDAADLAASYGHGLSRNHPFIDGNKRTAFVAVELFLSLNGLEFDATDTDCVLTMLAVAADDMDEATFAQWIRTHIHER